MSQCKLIQNKMRTLRHILFLMELYSEVTPGSCSKKFAITNDFILTQVLITLVL